MKVRFIIKEQVATPQEIAKEIPTDAETETETRNSLQQTIEGLDLNTLDNSQMQALQAFITGLQDGTGGTVAEEKKMTKPQIKKRDKIAKAIPTKDIEKQYGVGKKKAKDIKYAIATKTAMKKKK